MEPVNPFWWMQCPPGGQVSRDWWLDDADGPKPEPRETPTAPIDADHWGIPWLDPDQQATREDIERGLPWIQWGTSARQGKYPGRCVAFYRNDYQFSALQKHPEALVKTGAAVAVEPNFSTWAGQPLAESLWTIYRKRRIAAWWQKKGVKILVDLNVSKHVGQFTLLGVPRGWRAYATRKHPDIPWSETVAEYEAACSHAGTREILFCLFGGNKEGRRLAHENGWMWAQGRPPWRARRREAIRDGERPFGERGFE